VKSDFFCIFTISRGLHDGTLVRPRTQYTTIKVGYVRQCCIMSEITRYPDCARTMLHNFIAVRTPLCNLQFPFLSAPKSCTILFPKTSDFLHRLTKIASANYRALASKIGLYLSLSPDFKAAVGTKISMGISMSMGVRIEN